MASDVIQSRDDFFRVLDETLQLLSQRIQALPQWEPYQNLELQLYALKRFTANGRTPTEDERKSIDCGLVALRELEPAETPADQDFITNLHELNYYFANWPSDPHVAAEDPPLV